MRHIVTFIAAALIAMLPGRIAYADLAAAVEMFEPLKVSIDGRTAKVVLKQRRITDTVYLSVIANGVCLRQTTEPNILDNIEEIAVLNRFEGQGYVFEVSPERCAELIDMPIGKAREIRLMGYTHFH